MKIHTNLLLVSMGLVMAHLVQAESIFTEDFDSLNAGDINGQGGWSANVAGDMVVVDDSANAYSPSNYMTLGGGGAPQHSFESIDLSVEAVSLSFYFLSNTTTAGRNIQLSMRDATSGAGSILYLNLLGNGSGVIAGTSTSSNATYDFSSNLETAEWYLFSATTSPVSSELVFNITTGDGTTSLTTGTISLSDTAMTTARMVFSSNSSTVSGDWAIDNISVETTVIPEPGEASLYLGMILGLGIGLRVFARNYQGN